MSKRVPVDLSKEELEAILEGLDNAYNDGGFYNPKVMERLREALETFEE